MPGEQRERATLPSCGSAECEQPGARASGRRDGHDLKRDAGPDHDALQNEGRTPPSGARAHIAQAIVHRPAAPAVRSRVKDKDPQSTATDRSDQPAGAAASRSIVCASAVRRSQVLNSRRRNAATAALRSSRRAAAGCRARSFASHSSALSDVTPTSLGRLRIVRAASGSAGHAVRKASQDRFCFGFSAVPGTFR